jgi:hypothetical protein
MIFLEVTGNKGEDSMKIVEKLVENLMKEHDTFRIFVIDDIMEYKPSSDVVKTYRMISTSSTKKLEELFSYDYEEQIIVIYPMTDMNIRRAVMHHMVDNTDINCNKKVYCIHLCYSI